MPDKTGATVGPLFIGLMSGTSMDGVDAVLVEFNNEKVRLLGHTYLTWPQQLRDTLKQLALPGDHEIDTLGVADIDVANHFARAVAQLLKMTGATTQQIRAIGSHGQTIRHRPNATNPFTLQIGDPNQLSELTGITVVADFRRRDMAAGGQGAPLAPAFHAGLLHHPAEKRVVLNLGGIANITVLPADLSEGVIGFDTGPANTLMDAWILHNLQRPYDTDGAWAASGSVHAALLKACINHSYFTLPAPKSTGPELFNLDWLASLYPTIYDIDPADVQATLCALTVDTIIQSIERYAADSDRVICCGGGTENRYLMGQLEQGLKGVTVEDTATHGIDPDQIEATAFAWLAYQTLEKRCGNLPSVTGAAHPVILGGIYQT